MEENDLIFITEEEEGQRLGKILANRFKEVKSRTYFQFLIDQGKVLLNGELVKKRIKPSIGDEVQVQFILTPEINVEPENIPLNIIFEDDDLLIINKSAGMVVHPAPGNWTGTFVNALLYYCKSLNAEKGESLRPGIVHRLDKDTSGLLVAAKNSEAHQKLIQLFSSRQVFKEYIVLCIGNPGTREIEAPIGRHPNDRKKMAVVEGARKATSKCSLIATDGKLSCVSIVLITGRTHQIRVHLKHVGTPVLGDNIYGNQQVNQKYKADRQMLHAHTLRFDHPITGKPLEFICKPPDDMLRLIQCHKLNS